MGPVSPGVSPFVECGVASRPKGGETASGDLSLVCGFPEGVLVAVVDGLGHGPEAAAAAERAVGVLAEHPHASIIAQVRRCHQALIGTRGVVMTLAVFNVADDTLTWLGIGNVEGVLLRAGSRSRPVLESVVQRGGVVGGELPPLRAMLTTVTPGDVLVLASDGVRPDFASRLRLDVAPQRLADDILEGGHKESDDALVLAVRYRGRER